MTLFMKSSTKITSCFSIITGFLGLLMGGSFLSLIEIIYHLTFKRIFHSKNEDNDEKSYEEETAESLMTKPQLTLKSS